MRTLIVRATQTPGIGKVTCPRGIKGEIYLVKQCRQCPYFGEEGLLFRNMICTQYIGCNYKKK